MAGAGTSAGTKRTRKKAVPTASASASASASATATPVSVNPNEDGENQHEAGTGDGEVTLEPVVLQLNIPFDRMEEISNSLTEQVVMELEPEPYAPVSSFMSATNYQASIEEAEDLTDNGDTAKHNTVCFWCCHSLVDKEYGMPIRYDSVHNSFTLYGCFCSLECAAAHNFSLHMGSDRAWEIHSWIQLLARRYGYSGRVRPAPSKYLLKMFNGPLSIEEFRTVHKDLTRTYVMNIPPFIHVSSQMEVLNTSFLSQGPNTKDLKK